MSESKIGWRKLEGESAWVGVRGRIKFFTLRTSACDGLEAESYTLPYTLVSHVESAKQETLKPMRLAEAQAHAERELDNWLAKAGLVEPEKPSPLQHAINSALSIVEACIEDGVKSLGSEYGRQQFAQRIALYCTLSTLTELATIAQKAQDSEGHVADVLERRRKVLYEVMTDLKEMI
jgi:hypothetical protein